MRKLLFVLLAFFLPVLASAQSTGINYTPFSVSATGIGSQASFTATTNYDSVWTYLQTNGTISGVQVYQATLRGSSGTLGIYKASKDIAAQYIFANNLTTVGAGSSGAMSLTGAQHTLGLYFINLTADTATTGQTLVGSPLQWAVGVSQTWQFTAWLFVTSSSAAGVEVGVAVPTGATIQSYSYGGTSSATAFRADSVGASATATGAYATAAGTGGTFILVNGTITTDATHTGSAVMDFLKVTSGTATLKSGSYVLARRVS